MPAPQAGSPAARAGTAGKHAAAGEGEGGAIDAAYAEFDAAMEALTKAAAHVAKSASKVKAAMDVQRAKLTETSSTAQQDAVRKKAQLAQELEKFREEMMEDVVRQRLEVEAAAAEVASKRASTKRRAGRASNAANQKVTLDVGGHHFTTSEGTLSVVPDSFLARLATEQGARDESGRIFVDRDGESFRVILSFLREYAEAPERVAAEGGFQLSAAEGALTRKQYLNLVAEAKHYGVDSVMFPYHAVESVGLTILLQYERLYERLSHFGPAATPAGTRMDSNDAIIALSNAITFTKCLVVELKGSSVNSKLHGRYYMTPDMVNKAPIWVQQKSHNDFLPPYYMYFARDGRLWVSDKGAAMEGSNCGYLYNDICLPQKFRIPLHSDAKRWYANSDGASTQLWDSACARARSAGSPGQPVWVTAEDVQLAICHGLPNDIPEVVRATRICGHIK